MTNDKHGSHKCVSINKSASKAECANVQALSGNIGQGPALVNLPVTLTEVRVTSNLDANIHFTDPVLEIKDIKKRVKIVQCTLLLGGAELDENGDLITDIPLFIKGFVRKNIQYATPCHNASGECVASDLRSLTVDVPFDCVTTIAAEDFDRPPVLPEFNTRSEFDFFRAQKLGSGFPEKDRLLSSDLSQFHQVSNQFYNQFPFCELIDSRIVQYDEAIDRQPLNADAPFEEGVFFNMVEKSLLEFRVRVIQNQQVRIIAD